MPFSISTYKMSYKTILFCIGIQIFYLHNLFYVYRELVSSYLTHRNLGNFIIRVGSSYNNKGGTLYKVNKDQK